MPFAATYISTSLRCSLNGAGTVLTVTYTDSEPNGNNQYNQPQYKYFTRVVKIKCSPSFGA
jgi:hypothetical protein